MKLIPAPGYFGRLWTYLKEMYPLEQRVAGAVLLAVAIGMMFRRVHGLGPWFGPGTTLAAWDAFTFMLILRLMDELKDKDVDLALFRDRPLPSGRIHEADIVVTLGIVILLYLAPNFGNVMTAGGAVLVLAWSYQMFHWFFIPRIMRPNLPLTLVTHNPIVPLMLLDLVVVVAIGEGLRFSDVLWKPMLLFVAMVWAPSLGWEIARKIRSPEEEDAYVTYSRLMGPAGAVALAAAVQTASLAIGLWLWKSVGLHWIFPALLAGAWAAAMWMHARFLLRPGPATSNLRRPAEGFALGVLLATIAGCALRT